MSREVSREQFEVNGASAITHMPSGTKFTKRRYKDLDHLEMEHIDGIGEDILMNGDEFDIDTLRAVAEDILADVRQKER
jgi:hypothetical protein